MSTIGVIGLGRMGGNMSRRLIDSGFDVIGFDESEAATGRLLDAGGESGNSPAAVAAAANVVLTSLPSPEAVEDVFCSVGGILEGGDGCTVLETSTSDPDTTLALAELAAEENVRLVDAPVSGGPGPAADGVLTVMVGAEAGSLDPVAASVVEALSNEVFYLGEVGAGHTVKLVNNAMSMGTLLVTMEALALGVARGLDPETIFDVVSNSSGASAQLAKRAPRVMNRNFEAGFTVGLTRKDLGLALRAADAIDYPMLTGSAVHELYKEACAMGLEDEDACAIVKVFEANTGVPVESAADVDESYGGY